MYAGALQVISSLWPVGDRSSELLMSSFYRGLLTEGRAPAQALQQAQIELRASDQRFRPPRAWAGFTVAYRWPAKPAQSAASSAHVADGSRHPSGS
jgi:CHAT domain-containing protein